jgi:hypothetical protein
MNDSQIGIKQINAELAVKKMTDQELFEIMRTLVILYGDEMHVMILHEFKDRFNARQADGV